MRNLLSCVVVALSVALLATTVEARYCPLSNGYLSGYPCWAQTAMDYDGR